MSIEIYKREPVRYPDPESGRWASNNGFRRRWLKNGQIHADAVNAAREDKAGPALRLCSAGLKQPKTFAASVVRMAKALPADIPAYRITEGVVWTPQLSWDYQGKKQLARLDWFPLRGMRRRLEAA